VMNENFVRVASRVMPNPLYKERENRHLIDDKFRRLEKKDMTFILGAKCVDGVVMVGDTKVIVGDGTNYSYAKKIVSPASTIVVGAAGASGLFDSFLSRMQSGVIEFTQTQAFAEKNNQITYRLTTERMKVLVESVIRSMHRTYGEDRHLIIRYLDVLMAIRIHPEPEIINFLGSGVPEPVNEIKVIGHGQPYGELFIKKLWNPKMTMEQTAKLALFVIKMINENQIDASVGYRDPDYLPQVYFLPKVKIVKAEIDKIQDEKERQKAVDEIHSQTPIVELPPQTVVNYINDISYLMSKLNKMFDEWQFKV